MNSVGNSRLDALARLRLTAIGAAAVLGAAVAFLAYTAAGLVVLAIALALAAALAFWLWRTRPRLFARVARETSDEWVVASPAIGVERVRRAAPPEREFARQPSRPS